MGLCRLFIASVGILVPVIAFGQNDLLPQIGTPPNISSYQFPGGQINTNNGNVVISIPIETLKQRNGTTMTLTLEYNSLFWGLVPWYTDLNGDQYWEWAPVGNGEGQFQNTPYSAGWSFYVTNWVRPNAVQYTEDAIDDDDGVPCQPGACVGQSVTYEFQNFQFIDSTGTTHNFPGAYTAYTMSGPNQIYTYPTFSGLASDGSGYLISIVDYQFVTVFDSHGRQVYKNTEGVPGVSWVDNNGNIIEDSGYDTPPYSGEVITDQLGRSVQLPAGVTFQYGTVNVGTQFSGDPTFAPDYSGPIGVLSSITLPDGRQYSFTYDDGGTGHYGLMTGMTLPTGGKISFQQQTPIPSSAGGTIGYVPISKLTTPDGVWDFTYPGSTGWADPTPWTSVTVTEPTDPYTGQRSVKTFPSIPTPGPWGCTPLSNSSGTYTVQSTPTSGALRSIGETLDAVGRVLAATTTYEDGTQQKTTYTYADIPCNTTPPGIQPLKQLSSVKEYDFSGALARETDITYKFQIDGNYQTANLLDLPADVTIYGPGGAGSTPIAETRYGYDEFQLSTLSGSRLNSVLNSPGHDDSKYGTGNVIRGNLTSISRMVVPGTFLTTQTNHYNILGELIETDDGKGNATKFDYTDSWSPNSTVPNGSSPCVSSAATFAYPTLTTDPLGHATATEYNPCDGSIYSVRDQNDLTAGRAGTVYQYDGRQRVVGVTRSDGGSTTTDYGGAAIPEIVTTTVSATPDPSEVAKITLDGIGRTSIMQSNDAKGPIYTQTAYDGMGRTYQVWNPTRCIPSSSPCSGEPTWGLTTFYYDALDRPISQTQPDQSSLSWHYAGPVTESWDENGTHIQQTADALGRLSKVMELGTVSQPLSFETDYTYDPSDNLLSVNQHGAAGNSVRSRSFQYDSMSRLIQAFNPESGWNCYGTTAGGAPPNGQNCTEGYDPNGNLNYKTDARGVTTHFLYDALNRLVSKSYNDGMTPGTCYLYDTSTNGIGLLADEWTQKASVGNCASSVPSSGGYLTARSIAAYDPMGRLWSETQCTPSGCRSAQPCQTTSGFQSYAYDLAGNLICYSNGIPSTPGASSNPVAFSQSFDAASRLSTVTTNINNQAMTLFSVQGYAAFGGLPNATYGTNAVTLTRSYDNRLRFTGETDTGQVASPAMPGSATATITGQEQDR